MSLTSEITRIHNAKDSLKVVLEGKGCTVPSGATIDEYPAIAATIEPFDPISGHNYVEIGGVKWATMNIGANSITDTGLYFQWGGTCGFNSTGSGSGQKPFSWSDYVFGNGTNSPGTTGLTKYNSNDSKYTLDLSDDAAKANWGGAWRIPTTDELAILSGAVTTAWTSDYQGSGVSGLICTDKTENTKVLFFPAGGYFVSGTVESQGIAGFYWTNSINNNINDALMLAFNNESVTWNDYHYRYVGATIRPVLDYYII